MLNIIVENKKTSVQSYTVRDILKHVIKLHGFKKIPENYWLLGIQSSEDKYNEFDDIFILFNGTKYVTATTGTTNAGTTGLKNYDKYNSSGVLVVKTDEWYYDLWSYGLHKGRMPALRQIKPILYFRDWNKNKKTEEIGDLYSGHRGINFHTVLYQKNLSFVRKLIGGWSTGCQVINNVGDYYNILDKVKNQDKITYCLIKEF